ncbi:uncharacterized protein FIBRA_05924 [Fibroporia radiculosa]|uniref:USP domain-containing protein n=1 Tax=Fibroporia radiculosa TaxID=599839 RepID=J4HYB2_9APHY|nr:uncharacterized protein FIBRA_05924 [Fibroporia radiculosa]CCM03777.1 predicted protein [Fibroporia radiculosa]
MEHRASQSSSPTPKEQADVDTLMTLMGGGITSDVALKLLRKHFGDVEKAAAAIFDGGLTNEIQQLETAEVSSKRSRPQTPPPSKPENSSPVIDLTADDDDHELSRALRASLEDHAPKFGPSDRAPDPNWAVVPSNVEVGTGISQDDHSLSQAIAASLTYNYSEEAYEDIPLEQRVRKDEQPIALRSTNSSLAHAGLILHGLFHVPQVRYAIAQWRPTSESQENDDISPPTGGPAELVIWSLLEMFANMDVALMSELNVDELLAAMNAEHWSTPAERPGDIAYNFYNRLAWTAENMLQQDVAAANPELSMQRLFHFRYGFSNADLSHAPIDPKFDLSIVKVDVRGAEDTNDLISCLSGELGLTDLNPDPSRQQVIFESSEVVAFQIVRDNAPPTYTSSVGKGGRTDRTTFGYPKHVYLDQFMKSNLELANEKRGKQRELLAQIDELVAKKDALVRYNDRDTLADLRSSLRYYETVAEDNSDPQRKAELHDTAQKLRKALVRIENELQSGSATVSGKIYNPELSAAMDASVAHLKDQVTSMFDCPELQQHRYDLRVVLAHDGLYGRSHVYSYVKQKHIWWKTLDYIVNQVSEETVLTDPVGLHLGAGPFFLIYSRALTEEEESLQIAWPDNIKNDVKYNNQAFLSRLPPEVVARVSDPNSPPTSPYHSAAPSEYTMSSGTVEPPESREEPMDIV